MHAENVLGGGAPSKPIEVSLRAFLGHLRAQEEGRGKAQEKSWTLPTTNSSADRLHQEQGTLARTAVPPAQTSSSPVFGEAPIPTTPITSADSVTPPTVADNDGSCAKPPEDLTVVQKPHQQEEQRREPPDGNREGAQGGAPRVDQTTEDGTALASTVAVPSPPTSALAGDFMGLEGFGEARIHSLFAPPSSSPRRRRRRRVRAPAAGGTLGGDGTRENGPYPLPPIVLVSGISGESCGTNAAADGIHNLGFNGKMPNEEGGRWGGSHGGICGVAGTEGRLDSHGRASSSSCTANNDVFHAFINLGRRLPRRLRRDRDGS